jgi:hypothetical protein
MHSALLFQWNLRNFLRTYKFEKRTFGALPLSYAGIEARARIRTEDFHLRKGL